jgi:hypothetical protein
MSRIVLPDGTWFETDRAQAWDEETEFDGNNHISKATGSQWDHEKLYRTASGRFVLERSSQRQGVRDSHEIIDPKEAAAWLILNGHELPDALASVAKDLEV